MLPDISIDASLIKYSGTNSTAVLEAYSNQLSALSTASDFTDKLGSILVSLKGVTNAVGIGALGISFILDLAVTCLETRSESTMNMLHRVFAEEKASDVRDTMYEYMKRFRMHLHDPVEALEDTKHLEKRLSEQLTRLRNSMLHDNHMSSRSMKQWANGAAFHCQMLIHVARLKTENMSSHFNVYLSSVHAAIDFYQNDLQDLLKKYKDYKHSTLSVLPFWGWFLTEFDEFNLYSHSIRDVETGRSLDFFYGSPWSDSLVEYVNYMFTNWSQIKELNEYFTNLKENLEGDCASCSAPFGTRASSKIHKSATLPCMVPTMAHEQLPTQQRAFSLVGLCTSRVIIRGFWSFFVQMAELIKVKQKHLQTPLSRLKCMIRDIDESNVDYEQFKKNLEYTASLLEALYRDETRQSLDMEDQLQELRPDSVPKEVHNWLASTFMQQARRPLRYPDYKPSFRSIVHAVQAGIFVERMFRKMSSTAMTDQPLAVVNCLRVPISCLMSFLCELEQGYNKHNNPYHCQTHAADVTQTLHCLLLRTGLVVQYLEIEIFLKVKTKKIVAGAEPGTGNKMRTGLEVGMGLLARAGTGRSLSRVMVPWTAQDTRMASLTAQLAGYGDDTL
ncbi:hypothetical protein P4O66_000422 [Electrophorus voltai]|uniref:PDEase domain-containing protein n=1 Tax=Electrophorus voltai TaxID=2609070 RepID=A0AAD8ZK26_9TELE|nr:hypothetical protein P4O66_000422 [Electrophorus voltai]